MSSTESVVSLPRVQLHFLKVFIREVNPYRLHLEEGELEIDAFKNSKSSRWAWVVLLILLPCFMWTSLFESHPDVIQYVMKVRS